ncbi:MAG: iojap-like ribosome-associated protein [Chthonomonadaceae bacterium]|nr:iojap-like ribosome-associated protein [Chthonomonadaceae bacterium]
MTNSTEQTTTVLQDEMELEEDELELEEMDEDLIEDEIDDELEEEAPVATLQDLDTEERLEIIVKAADAVKATDLIALDLRGLTIIADFFVICTGKSSIQIRGIADRMEEKMRESGYRKLRMEGYQEATWILIDFGDVVAHIMAEEQRAFFRLEEFWSEAPHVELNLVPEPATLNASSLAP